MSKMLFLVLACCEVRSKMKLHGENMLHGYFVKTWSKAKGNLKIDEHYVLV